MYWNESKETPPEKLNQAKQSSVFRHYPTYLIVQYFRYRNLVLVIFSNGNKNNKIFNNNISTHLPMGSLAGIRWWNVLKEMATLTWTESTETNCKLCGIFSERAVNISCVQAVSVIIMWCPSFRLYSAARVKNDYKVNDRTGLPL